MTHLTQPLELFLVLPIYHANAVVNVFCSPLLTAGFADSLRRISQMEF